MAHLNPLQGPIGSLISVQVALKPSELRDFSAVMNETLKTSKTETTSRVSFVRPAPHNSIGVADKSFQIRTTAFAQPRAEMKREETVSRRRSNEEEESK